MPVTWKDALTAPRSIALVGASKEEGTLNYRLMVGFLNNHPRCKVYLVNPKWDSFQEHKFYRSLDEIEDDVDLACIMTSAKVVKNVLVECVKKKVSCANVISAGFGETGHTTGKDLQREILEITKNSETRVLGPNALGVISLPQNIVLDLYPETMQFVPGNVSIIAQSNGVAHLVTEKLAEIGIGVRYVYCLGNQCDLNVSDFVELLANDTETRIIVAYIESLKDIKKFTEASKMARKASKPIIVLKAGRTEKGKLAVLSHTASLGGSHNSYVAYSKQNGILMVNTIQELLDTLTVFHAGIIPKKSGLAAVFNSGGFCALVADRCEETDVPLANLSQDTISTMSELLNENAKESHILPTIKNPMDVGFFAFDWNVYGRLTQLVSKDPDVGIVLSSMLDHGSLANERARLFIELSKECRTMGKLFICVWAASFFNDQETLKLLSSNKVPTYANPENAVDAVRQLLAYASRRGEGSSGKA